jgi:hypothetical protein
LPLYNNSREKNAHTMGEKWLLGAQLICCSWKAQVDKQIALKFLTFNDHNQVDIFFS